MKPAVEPRPSPVREAIFRCRPHFVAIALFSAVSNLLYLTPSIYMMQVYERVIPTGGLVTLAAMSVIALIGLATLSALDWLRGRLLVRVGAQLDTELAGRSLRLVMSRPELSRLDRAEAMRELDTLRQGTSSPAISALFDLPWTPIYILVAACLHPLLGVLTFVAACVLLALAWSNERGVRRPSQVAAEAAAVTYSKQIQMSAHAAEIRALGMIGALTRRQLEARAEVNRLQAQASFTGGDHAGVIKFIRLVLQSAALGVGALLVVEGKMSGGAVFAASLLMSRALQPIEQVVAAWKSILQSRTAYTKLDTLFAAEDDRSHTLLPAPSGAISVERLTVVAPNSNRVALADAHFAVAAGEIIGVVGPSGAGKSTLLRSIAGATIAARGHVRFDGASLLDWDSERLARHIGYLPQSYVLFAGTVKENITRFRGDPDEDAEALDAAAIEAAQAVDAHNMIIRLPDGYDTMIGTGGIGLSSGQTQRIALARAMFGKPRILILDEPTAHLDADAQHAFLRTLARLRGERVTVLFATHSNDILAATDKLLVIREGRIDRFAPLADAVAQLRPVSHVPQKVS